ncbi:hypothetical protein OGATHE_000877 [Ogataea polymorpha]|uniref:Uncharacterized protein n=1 Tax=Ogataea polymorpha TaxID=460523 RepID=A0A9P8TF89_9ASCO|nr:hypothetical protein OGATHE_000877 [Ogataea polymorpha]
MLSLAASKGESSESSISDVKSFSLVPSLWSATSSSTPFLSSCDALLLGCSSSTASFTILEHVPSGPVNVRSLNELKSIPVGLSTTCIL